MKYNYSNEINQFLLSLEKNILKEYDNSKEISVRVHLMPIIHNALSEYEKIFDENGTRKTIINKHNMEHAKTLIAIHEASPGPSDDSMPTKPNESVRGINHYEKLIRYGAKNKEYGSTIGYHAMVAYPGLLNVPEIVIYLPATSSPDQITNRDLGKFTYGIERLCGDGQNYHLAVANQAMLSAFVLRELGYDANSGTRHVFPHHFYAKNRKECPARMLYASKLLAKTIDGTELTQEEFDIIKEYVPWQVFSNLVQTFLERNKYPQQLEKKFIMDMDDYKAYNDEPNSYNYAERKKSKNLKYDVDSVELTGARHINDDLIFHDINEDDFER